MGRQEGPDVPLLREPALLTPPPPLHCLSAEPKGKEKALIGQSVSQSVSQLLPPWEVLACILSVRPHL